MVAGVIYDVAKNELFTAAKGEGAFLDNRRIRVSDRKDMNRAVIGTASRSAARTTSRAT